MRIISRLIVATLAACSATMAFAQTVDESVRLRLVLDQEGRLHLSTEPLLHATPSLRVIRQPSLSGANGALVPTASAVAIDFTAAHADGALPCTPSAGGLARFNALVGCELVGYGGLPGAVHSGDLSLRFGGDRGFGVDLSYGLDWIDASSSADASSHWLALGELPQAAATLLLPGWVGPMMGEAGLRAERFGLGGFAWLGPDLRINLDYQHSQGALALLALDPLQAARAFPGQTAEQNSLSIGMNYGRFQGALTGRQLRPDSPMAGPAQNSLDLGFSWRMPWNAALEFGARNLIVRPKASEGTEAEVDESDLRVPYLRYHQEL